MDPRRFLLPSGLVVRTLVRRARPRGTLLLLLVPTTGYGFGHWDRALALREPYALAVVLVAWAVLSTGTMWWNAALDGDEGEALFEATGSRDRPEGRAPRLLSRLGRGLLGVAPAIAAVAGVRPFLACLVCSLLSFVYSHPRTRWKAHPVFGPMVNAIGYGGLSLVAGWSVVGVEMNPRTATTFALCSLAALALSFAAQAFQEGDDRARGYRTFVVTHGPAACLSVAHGVMRVVFAGFLSLALVGVFPRACLGAIVAFLVCDRAFRRAREAAGGRSARAVVSVVHRLVASAVALTALAAVDYARDYDAGAAVCGLATAKWQPKR